MKETTMTLIYRQVYYDSRSMCRLACICEVWMVSYLLFFSPSLFFECSYMGSTLLYL